MKKSFIMLGIAALMIFASGCSSQKKVTRVSPDEQIDLSGRWNDTDSRLTADAMISQSLTEAWLNNFRDTHGGDKPVIICGFVKNKSHEHIDAETFIKDLEKAFINSQQIRLVQGGEKRDDIRLERADQQDYSSAETMKAWGREMGADFMLQGSINSIVDSEGRETVNFYQINLELTNIETNEIVWIGDKKIKKYIKN
ncbi:MAG: penicillin-binding protein activator LpoB [Bacteroidetes bacterium]|nr:MAG: penicillin-binding protein activator LpoB [Bacteroidota bacterium]